VTVDLRQHGKLCLRLIARRRNPRLPWSTEPIRAQKEFRTLKAIRQHGKENRLIIPVSRKINSLFHRIIQF
jgi:hypothetical protein